MVASSYIYKQNEEEACIVFRENPGVQWKYEFPCHWEHKFSMIVVYGCSVGSLESNFEAHKHKTYGK